ncbi:hypothetical protein LJ655_14825 [Paraburkholderia sp. MMS20-SJTN17]|uniref:Uncharacterized protein n=1 Tax=Paraburkholderia translucens TaxID=2886945 RepID=A0ABS8KED7_9BURK|nr:hypothetical protein [Paraburkholderia sp. MMS20-SJTN17]MCC8403146.1 hypothetical protein [Paraburkholderia sp. MMS20-SJTN17]
MFTVYEPFNLADFEVQRAQIKPLVSSLRFANVLIDTIFYDVNAFHRAMKIDGLDVTIHAPRDSCAQFARALQEVDLGALANPEGAIVIVDASATPHIQCFFDVSEFLGAKDGVSRIDSISVSGVGSSALGSAALAWNVSRAMGKPVAGIVPGYGLADVVQQALGGFFGFGLFTYWMKQPLQNTLAVLVPGAASVGRSLVATVPGTKTAATEAPVFQHGSGSSDVLHYILKHTDHIRTLVGHSKGALVIENAIAEQKEETLRRLKILTFACSIREQPAVGEYEQYLGIIDALGLLGSAGNRPEHAVPTWHSTNSEMPLTMHVATLAHP